MIETNPQEVGNILLFLFLIAVLGIFFFFIISSQQHIDINKLCQECGYEEVTDAKYVFPFSLAPMIDKLECDGSYIITVYYEKKENKWGDDFEYDFNKPYTYCSL